MKIIAHPELVTEQVNFNEIIERLFNYRTAGYTLWVGAGVTMHLGQHGDFRTLSWQGLVHALEKKAGLPSGSGEYADRLELVSDILSPKVFQQELRQHILFPLCDAVMKLEEIRVRHYAAFREIINSFMKLGLRANVIVNFNIEPFTSILLAFTFDYQIKNYQPLPDSRLKAIVDPIFKHPSSDGSGPCNHRHVRHVIHPHGNLEGSGTCVMKRSEYNILSGKPTLAFQLAVHHAFQSPLVIVGMSLEDAYLCEQIQDYRNDIEEILWFIVENPTIDKLQWARQNRITLVKFDSYAHLWGSLNRIQLIPDTPELLITEGWKKVYSLAQSILAGKEQIRQHISDPNLDKEWRDRLVELAERQGIVLEHHDF